MTAEREVMIAFCRRMGRGVFLRLAREVAEEDAGQSPVRKRTPKELDDEVRHRLWRAGVKVDDDAA